MSSAPAPSATDMDVDNTATDRAGPDADDAEVYSNIIRIMAATVNASLAELGHFPMSGQLLQELRSQNQQFREVVVRLHDDNVTLSRNVDGLKKRVHELEQHLAQSQQELRNMHQFLQQTVQERDQLAYQLRTQQALSFVQANQQFPQGANGTMHQPVPPAAIIPNFHSSDQMPRPPQAAAPRRIVTTPIAITPSGSTRASPVRTLSAPQHGVETIDLTHTPEEAPQPEPPAKRPRLTITLRPPGATPAAPSPPPISVTQLGQQIAQLGHDFNTADASPSTSAQAMEQDTQAEDEGDDDGDVLQRTIDMVFERQDDGFRCRFCQFRKTRVPGTDDAEAPNLMPGDSTQEDLLRHMEEVHPAGWKRFRAKIIA